MYNHVELEKLDDYFLPCSKRAGKGVFFYRITGWSEEVVDFLGRYMDAALKSGIVIEGKIPNPDRNNLAYYQEMMGLAFQMSREFISDSLARWLPRLDGRQRADVTDALYSVLEQMIQNGKNENMCKNAYIKFMCWLYYKFERILSQLGREQLPKVLYEGTVNSYELDLLSILSRAGCDVVMVQYDGGRAYEALDPSSRFCHVWPSGAAAPFPQDFTLKGLRSRRAQQARLQAVCPESNVICLTNSWVEQDLYQAILTPGEQRGARAGECRNCFVRIAGVENKDTYLNEWYQRYLRFQQTKRRIVVVNGEIPPPSVGEIGKIRRKQYREFTPMLTDLSGNINYPAGRELTMLMRRGFFELLTEEQKRMGDNLNRLTNRAVYLLCWLNRYQDQLFARWKAPEIAVFIHFGPCQDPAEALFLRLLARLPADVLILVPDLEQACRLAAPELVELHGPLSLPVREFPIADGDLQMGTAAYHAEQELNSMLYQDTGLYRNQQYQKAVSVTLRTLYEEIEILWNQEAQFRPNFSVVDGLVTLPVIFAKVSGVKDGRKNDYWKGIKNLLTDDALLIRRVPYIRSQDANPMRSCAAEFYKNGRLRTDRIRAHRNYPYRHLREQTQEHLLEKLQLLIDARLIQGTGTQGTEYTIISTVLNLPREITRMLQKFDFTRQIPKVVCVNTGECMYSLEDAILLAFLNLAGFDVLVFTPTGYQGVERYYTKELMEEHQAGEYLYDMVAPDFNNFEFSTLLERGRSWKDKLFRRGN